MDKYFNPKDIIDGYSIIKMIGQGRYGIVYLAENYNKEKFIVKQLKKDMLKQTREQIKYEQQMLQRLDDPHFPKFISKFNDGDREGFILEYIEGKIFHDILIKDNYKFSKNEIYRVCSELLDLVEILHKNKIVHRDIRTPNVILNKNNELSLIDFGLARNMDNTRYTKELDYWFIGDFLIHLYYSSYESRGFKERPWFEELDLNYKEVTFLKRLMAIEKTYKSIDEIREDLDKIIKFES